MATSFAIKPGTKEPFHTRRSDMYGVVSLYAPSGDPQTWSGKPWKLTTEKGPDGPMKFTVKAEYLMEAFERPHFIAGSVWEYGENVTLS